MTDYKPSHPSWWTLSGFAVAWLVLLALHYVLMFMFAGWLGTADDFVPWSLTGLLLWHWTRRGIGLPALLSTTAGRAVFGMIAGLICLALLGVDEGRMPVVPALPAAVVYALLPVVIVTGILMLLVSIGRRARPNGLVAAAKGP